MKKSIIFLFFSFIFLGACTSIADEEKRVNLDKEIAQLKEKREVLLSQKQTLLLEQQELLLHKYANTIATVLLTERVSEKKIYRQGVEVIRINLNYPERVILTINTQGEKLPVIYTYLFKAEQLFLEIDNGQEIVSDPVTIFLAREHFQNISDGLQ